MTDGSFYEEGSCILTPRAFDFVLAMELKRAVRSQDFLTLVSLEMRREWDGITVAADDGTLCEVGQIIAKEVRGTDFVGHVGEGTLDLVLLNCGFEVSVRVVQRVGARILPYQFPTALRIAVGAACYPAHASDAPSLMRQAAARPLVNWRGGTDILDSVALPAKKRAES
jgi:GGDEF domain-containing protein